MRYKPGDLVEIIANRRSRHKHLSGKVGAIKCKAHIKDFNVIALPQDRQRKERPPVAPQKWVVSVDRPDVHGGYTYHTLHEDWFRRHRCRKSCPKHTSLMGL